MPVPLDEHGQPPLQFYAARVAERAISELLGLCKGMVCDGLITKGEARGLRDWIAANPNALETFPANVLVERLGRIYADGEADEEERHDLFELLQAVTGTASSGDLSLNRATALPLDEPPPALVFAGQEYVFTGKMVYGTRRTCEQAVIARGGTTHSGVTMRTDVLVIGTLGSAAWKESTHGTKILRALELKERGQPLVIVGEAHWVQCLSS
jgi:hypothetical protein